MQGTADTISTLASKAGYALLALERVTLLVSCPATPALRIRMLESLCQRLLPRPPSIFVCAQASVLGSNPPLPFWQHHNQQARSLP